MATEHATPGAYTYPLLIKHLLHMPLAHAPEQEIVYRDRGRYSYRDLRERIARLANALAALGVKPGDTVAVMDWDSHRYLECFFAVPMMGAVLQTVNVRLSPEQVLYTLNHAGASILLCNAEFAPLLTAIKDQLETVRDFVLLRDGNDSQGLPVPIAAEYEAALAASSAEHEFPDFDENTRATTFYTSGTTGLPKGVWYTHRQLVLHTMALLAAFGSAARQGRFHRDDVYMPITPMFHVHAWGFPYAATLLGIKQVYPGRYAPDVLLDLIKKEGVTFSHCVPTILQMLLTCPAIQDVDLKNWKVVIGGSALPKGLAKAALDRGIDVFSGYGMSETCPVLTTAHLTAETLEASPEQQLATRVLTGLPLPLVDLRVVDESMCDLPRDGATVGEVVVRAPWLTQGYWRDPAASAQLWAGGYLHTSDIGNIDGHGYLQVTDRIKDVIKSGGEWVSSLQIEDILSQHEAVGEVAVIGIKDECWGERPVAVVVPKPAFAGRVDADRIRAFVQSYADKGTISSYGVPDRILFVEALEKTSVGKLDKKAMREKYESVR
jgi:fatty-acyl-CoA synthase